MIVSRAILKPEGAGAMSQDVSVRENRMSGRRPGLRIIGGAL